MIARALGSILLVTLAAAPAAAQRSAAATTQAGVPDARALRVGVESLAAFSKALETLADRVSQSVVQIVVVGYAPASEAPSSDTLFERQRSTGSGVIVDSTGFIVTNHHVVQGARRVQVMLPIRRDPSTGRSIVRPRGRVVEARVVGIDDETDLAVLKVEAAGLQALPFGDSDTLRTGQIVCAFGSPLGLENSMSMGVVSAVGRQLEPDAPMVYVQTDAPINPGNSGGPLVDTEGRLMGISTLILSQSGGNEGLGFAAPSNIVQSIFEQIRKTGRVRRGTIGVHAQTLTPLMARGLGLAHDVGVVLGDVAPGSTGAAAGLQVGDIVLMLDGKPMENGRQFDVNLYRRGAGDIVTLEVLRDGQQMKFPVAVAEREDEAMQFADLVSPERNVIERLGVLAIDVTPAVATALGGLRRNGGALVATRAMNAAAVYGLQPGDVIFSVNATPVAGLVALRTLIGRLPANAPCVLQVQREGRLMYLSFEIE